MSHRARLRDMQVNVNRPFEAKYFLCKSASAGTRKAHPQLLHSLPQHPSANSRSPRQHLLHSLFQGHIIRIPLRKQVKLRFGYL